MKTITLLLAISLSACTATTSGPTQTVGGLLGGVGGAVIGAQFGGGAGQLAATAAGALAGAFIGSEVGKSLDAADALTANQAAAQSMQAPVGTHITWHNPRTGNAGYTRTDAEFFNQRNLCRQYTTVIFINGQEERATGTACRDHTGQWQLQ